MRKWQRMPTTFGPYWFAKTLDDRDLADLVRVSRVEYGDGTVEFHKGYDTPIRPDEGWWLLIPDERKTAEVEAP